MVTTLDPAHTGANFTLSGGNLTATGNGLGNATSRSTTSHASGMYYFEVTWTVAGGSTTSTMGVAKSSLSTTLNVLGLDANISIGANENSNIYINNGNGSITWVVPVNGDVCAVAVDFTNQLIWARDMTTGNGYWNNNAAYSPGGTGGVSFSAISGPYFAAISVNSNVDQLTINFGNQAFTGAVPAGFAAWDGVAAPALVYAPPRSGQTRWRPRKHFRRTPQFLPRHIYVVPFRLPQTPVAAMVMQVPSRRKFQRSRHFKFFRQNFRPRHIIFPPKQPVKLIPQIIAQFQHRYARRKAHGFFPRQFRPKHIWSAPTTWTPVTTYTSGQTVVYNGQPYVASTAPSNINHPPVLSGGAINTTYWSPSGMPIGVYAPVPGTGVEKQRLTQPELFQERVVAPGLYRERVAAPELYPEE